MHWQIFKAIELKSLFRKCITNNLMFQSIIQMCHFFFQLMKMMKVQNDESLKSPEIPWESIMTGNKVFHIFQTNKPNWAKNYTANSRYLINTFTKLSEYLFRQLSRAYKQTDTKLLGHHIKLQLTFQQQQQQQKQQ